MKTTIKFSLMTLALLGLAACGSGGGGDSATTSSEKNDKTPMVLDKSEKPSKPLKQPISNEIKVKKTLFRGTDEYTPTDKVIMFNKEYQGKEIDQIELDLFPRYELVEEDWKGGFLVEYEGKKVEYIKGVFRIYNQIYSGVVGADETEIVIAGKKIDEDPVYTYNISDIVGRNTTTKELPTSSVATYHGIAFDKTQEGRLIYHVDFGKKEGFGEITGIDQFGKITLEKGKIGNLTDEQQRDEFFRNTNQLGITGVAKSEKMSPTQDLVKAYDLQFFGPKAEEIGGVVRSLRQYKDRPEDKIFDGKVGFAGKR